MAAKEEKRTMEEAMEALDEMVEQLESREISLEDSFLVYQKGMELLKYCNQKIDKVEKKMLQVNDDGETSEF